MDNEGVIELITLDCVELRILNTSHHNVNLTVIQSITVLFKTIFFLSELPRFDLSAPNGTRSTTDSPR